VRGRTVNSTRTAQARGEQPTEKAKARRAQGSRQGRGRRR